MKKITVVGLGFGNEKSLSLGTKERLGQSSSVWLRTEKHPVVDWLKKQGASFQTFDAVYEEKHNFASVYQEIVDRLVEATQQHPHIVYAVPGHPMVAEKTVQILLQEAPTYGIQVEVCPGESFLDVVFSRLQIDPIEGFQLLDGNVLRPSQIQPQVHVLISQVYSRLIASEVKLSLMDVYPDHYAVYLVTALGIESMERVQKIPLYELDRLDWFTDLTSVYVPPVEDTEILYQRFDFLTDVIAYLRSPDGCPWDREQTHESLRPYLLEEAYEFLDAVHKQDVESMNEELGDVLLQVVLHAQIARETGIFDIHDVIRTLTEKMIRRHPHVFGERMVDTADQVVTNWEEIKKQEKTESVSSHLDSIPDQLPQLLQAVEIQKRAAKAGFKWEQVEQIWSKIKEEIEELRVAEKGKREEELGDLLFAISTLANHYQIQPEIALYRSNQKFRQRFTYIEKKAMESKKPISSIPKEILYQWWKESKQST